MTSNLIHCASGYQVEYKHRCILEYDERQDIMGCKDVTHIQNCQHFICTQPNYKKCPNRLVRNGDFRVFINTIQVLLFLLTSLLMFSVTALLHV